MTRRRSDVWIVRACLISAVMACLLAALNIMALGRFFSWLKSAEDLLRGESLRPHFGGSHMPIGFRSSECAPCTIQDMDSLSFIVSAITWGAPAAFMMILGMMVVSRKGWLAIILVAGLTSTASAESVTGWLHPEIIDRLERFITTVGFSVLTALWFMFRAEKRLDEGNKLQTEQIRLLKILLGEKED